MLHKRHLIYCIPVLFCLLLQQGEAHAQITPDTTLSRSTAVTDSLHLQSVSKKKQREINKKIFWDEFRHSHSRFFIQGNIIYAYLDTKLDFSIPGTVFHAVIGLENNLGLPKNSLITSGSIFWRITPGSGLYLNYYGLNRQKSYTTRNDLPWGNDTIPAGTYYNFFFNTQVISAGYVFSILKSPDAFLGAYFNVYLMLIRTGMSIENLQLTDATLNATVPLPNLGLLSMFRLTHWLELSGSIGVFTLYTDALGGYIQDIKLAMVFKVTPWMALSASYKKFFVHALFPRSGVNTVVEYDFKGPAAGIIVKF